MQFEKTKISFWYLCDNLGHVKQLYFDISYTQDYVFVLIIYK